MSNEEIIEMVYSEALALPEDLELESGATPYDHDLLRWVARRLHARMTNQLGYRDVR